MQYIQLFVRIPKQIHPYIYDIIVYLIYLYIHHIYNIYIYIYICLMGHQKDKNDSYILWISYISYEQHPTYPTETNMFAWMCMHPMHSCLCRHTIWMVDAPDWPQFPINLNLADGFGIFDGHPWNQTYQKWSHAWVCIPTPQQSTGQWQIHVQHHCPGVWQTGPHMYYMYY